MKEKKYCPLNSWDCPYYSKDGECTLENVETECNDYASFWADFENNETIITVYEGR